MQLVQLAPMYVVLDEATFPGISTTEVSSAKLAWPIEPKTATFMGNTPGWNKLEYSLNTLTA